jgi:hypothetical protein
MQNRSASRKDPNPLAGCWKKTEMRGEGRGADGESINIHDLLVVLAEVEVLFVVEEKVLRWGGGDD